MSKCLRGKRFEENAPPSSSDGGGSEQQPNNPNHSPAPPIDPILRTVIHNMPEVVILIDRDMRVLEANRAALDAMGVSGNPRDLVLTPDIDPGLVTDEAGNKKTWHNSVQRRVMMGETIVGEVQVHYRKDGSVRYFVADGHPIRDAEGNVTAALIVSRDVTKLKNLQLRAEEKLRGVVLQERALRSVINSMPAGVIILDSELRLISWNKAYLHYFDPHVRWEEGKPLVEVIPSLGEGGLLNRMRRAIRAGRAETVREQPIVLQGRQTTYWNGTAVPIEISLEKGPVHGLAVIAVDVTQEVRARKRLSETLRLARQRTSEAEHERARLDCIVQSLPIAVCTWTPDGRLDIHNTAADDLFHLFGLDEWLSPDGEAPTLGNITSGEPRPSFVTEAVGRIARSLGGEVVAGTTIRTHDRSGRTRALKMSTAPLRDPTGQITGSVSAAMDVTDQVRAQDHIRDVYRREHAIAEKLQTSFLHTEVPVTPGFEIGLRYRAGLDEAMVGGDFHDVFRLTEDKLGIVIADVAGKGLKAAVYTAMTKFMLRAYALEDSSPESVLCRLNLALSACTPPEVFVTLAYGILDIGAREFCYANAGHEPPIHYVGQRRMAMTLDVTGRALALVGNSSYSCRAVHFEPGDVLALYTDGITDAGSGPNRLGTDRLMAEIESRASSSAERLAAELIEVAERFADGPPGDDIALVVLRATA